MKNFETGEKLIGEAEEYYLDLLQAYKRRSWNTVARRAQEVVELSLKGLLKMMGIEYPKIHDVGWLLEKIVLEKGVEAKKETIKEIKEISASLARDRSPAFYMETTYSKLQAEKAKRQAERVLSWAREMTGKLKEK
ncbi:MAG: HEPN domain-containing protein [Candidatus Aerophobetes bacterium]|nr:HEPN domain-containing protein [Candidatus Aerophobetes bacterium]